MDIYIDILNFLMAVASHSLSVLRKEALFLLLKEIVQQFPHSRAEISGLYSLKNSVFYRKESLLCEVTMK